MYADVLPPENDIINFVLSMFNRITNGQVIVLHCYSLILKLKKPPLKKRKEKNVSPSIRVQEARTQSPGTLPAILKLWYSWAFKYFKHSVGHCLPRQPL